MYKLFLPLFIICICCSCSDTQKVNPIPSTEQRVELAKTETAFDSSIVVLGSFRKIALTDLLCRDWNVEDADKKHWSVIFWDSIADKRKYPGFSLFHDYTVTENPRTEIKFGKWEIDKPNRILRLKMKDGTEKSYYVQELSLSYMILTWEENGDSAWIKLNADGLVHKEDANDPYYPANNRWRIKPAKLESYDELTVRVKNCVHFYSAFFKDNYQKQLTDISYIGLPSCFEWYNGGIGLPATIELDKKWKNCFYSDDQAYKGYDLIKDIIERHVLEWPDKHMIWTKRIQIVLDQMHDRL
ncbi:MAG: hypothetical protein C5B59_19040 [Bacteroidetes bacterium]|nr:MAG: hypothetical protein C5B59_19040 [Bacteroidota bacterium]